MSIKIDKNKCVSCGKCPNICPGNLIYSDSEQKAFIKYPKDCWGCAACVKECPVQAIFLYLGKDIGGNGGTIHTSQPEKDRLNWHFISKSGDERTITINRKESIHFQGGIQALWQAGYALVSGQGFDSTDVAGTEGIFRALPVPDDPR